MTALAKEPVRHINPELLNMAEKFSELAAVVKSAAMNYDTANFMLSLENLKCLKEVKDLLNGDMSESLVSDFGRFYAAFNQELVSYMINEEIPSINRGGKCFHLTTRTSASPIEGCKEMLYEYLRNNGHPDVIKETVNANTLSSIVKEIRDENGGQLPEDLKPLVSVFDKTTVNIRSGK